MRWAEHQRAQRQRAQLVPYALAFARHGGRVQAERPPLVTSPVVLASLLLLAGMAVVGVAVWLPAVWTRQGRAV
jgi:formate hydrogenlyase subunit 3/multisubunit Na+/H+ antiporter MnhD subunit